MRKFGSTTQAAEQTYRTGQRRMRKLQSGQSLLEVALSMVILVMLFSAIVDFGRAFFTVVALNNMISEGAHWAAAYPQCIATAANATNAPQVDPKCRGTNSIIGRMLNENQDIDPAMITALTIAPTTAQAGETLTISIAYQLPTITPIVRSLFGNSLTLTSEAKEVVRGSGTPDYAGTGMTNNGSVPPVTSVGSVQQLPSACANGVATLQWNAVSATGYHIYKGNTVTPPAYATITPSSAIGTIMQWTYQLTSGSTLGTGGTQQFTVTSYNDNGTIYDSTPVTMTASCMPIKPAVTSWLCPTGGATFNWTMPAPTDTAVTGYQIYRVDGPTTYTSMGSPVSASPGSITFGAPTDKTASYAVRALAGATPIGDYSPAVPINCAPGTGLQGDYFNNTALTAPIVLTRTDATVSFDWGSGSPDPIVNTSNFSAQWTGQVLPQFSETYTFYVTADDGVRLWVNGQQLTPDSAWSIHGATMYSGTIPLTAGQRADIKLQYFQASGVASVKLEWSSPSVGVQQVIPQSQLYRPGS